MLYPEAARFTGKRNRFFNDISGRTYETYRIGHLDWRHKRRKRNIDDREQYLVENTLFIYGTVQKRCGNQSGRIDCSSPCRLFHDGFVRTAGSPGHDGRRNQDNGNTGDGQNGKRIFDQTHPFGCQCAYSKRRCRCLSYGSFSCKGKLQMTRKRAASSRCRPFPIAPQSGPSYRGITGCRALTKGPRPG